MSIDLPVFDLRNLKKAYYTNLVVNAIVIISSILAIGLLPNTINVKILEGLNNWVLFFVLLAISIVFSNRSKKE